MRHRACHQVNVLRAAAACAFAGLLWAGAGAPTHAAEALNLTLPIDCDMASVCSIQNYVDVDPGSGARDYRCGTLTYDGHQGTDFQLPDLAAMRRGVVVRAAADGTVRNIRDGVPDLGFEHWQQTGSESTALGNAVAISHPDGSETLYGHLRQGSVLVQPGSRVVAGQAIARVGLSGKTQFPHLHFQLVRAGMPVDPFTGTPATRTDCGATNSPLWHAATLAQLAYRPAVLVCSGFALAVPDRKAIQDTCSSLTTASADSAALVLFAEIAGVQKGDRLRFAILLPDGNPLVDNAIAVDRPRARLFRYVGQRRPGTAWPAGRYTAKVELTRPAVPSRAALSGLLIDAGRDLEIR
jgi:murein DD-endopeptidase MepM/ murein hydrolase activator NlpD